MRKVIIYLHVFICSVIIGQLFSIQKNVHSKEPKSCTAHVINIYQGNRVNMFVDFIGSPMDKKGMVSLSGNYISNLDGKFFFRREITFEWINSGEDFFLKSNNIHKIINDDYLTDEILSEFLTDFYIATGNVVYYRIIRVSDKGYLFLLGDRPLFFCQK